MGTVRAVRGVVAVALLATVLAVVGVPGPAAAVEPTSIVPTGVAASVRSLSCPTDDVCWSAGLEDGTEPGDRVAVVHRVVSGVQQASIPLPLGAGEVLNPQGIECWSETDCIVLLQHQHDEDSATHLATSRITSGVPAAPVDLAVGSAGTTSFTAVSCSGSTCTAAAYDSAADLFELGTSYLVTLPPAGAPVVTTVAHAVAADIDCLGPASCIVVGFFGANVFTPTGSVARLAGNTLVDVRPNVTVSPTKVECESLTSCLYLDGGVAGAGVGVGRVNAAGLQPPTLMPGFLVAVDLDCGSGIADCLAVGFGDDLFARIALIEDGVPEPASVIEELRLVSSVGCGPTTCAALGYTEVDPEVGLAPANARLLTGLALPAPVATKLTVEPALGKVQGLVITPSRGLAATLTTTAGVPLAGKTVSFTAGGQPMCSAVTGANGRATCNPGFAKFLFLATTGGVTATFAGDAGALPSQGQAGLVG